MGNLPLNFKPGGGVGGVGKAQNFSVSKLNLQKDRDNAKVSVNQVGSQTRPTTSVSRVGESKEATTSINRSKTAKRSIADKEYYDENADKRRYDYIRRLIRARKAKEGAENILGEEDSKFSLELGTGKTFQRKFRTGFDKVFSKKVRKQRQTLKNISKKDRDFLGDLIEGHASKRATGSGYSPSDRRRMKMEVERARRAGKISHADSKDFKKILDKLK